MTKNQELDNPEYRKGSQRERQRLNQETSSIPWHELQRFFAAGQAIYIAPELDLVDVALAVSKDNTEPVQSWLQDHKIANVSDEQAKLWLANDVDVWAVVVKPWILVQLYSSDD